MTEPQLDDRTMNTIAVMLSVHIQTYGFLEEEQGEKVRHMLKTRDPGELLEVAAMLAERERAASEPEARRDEPHEFHMSSYITEPRCWCERFADDPIHVTGP
jgi:hypothetical protein